MDGNQLHEKYQLWWSNRTQDEYKLHETIIDYDEYFFEDMAFQKNSLCWNIYSFISENMEELYLDLSSSKWMYRFLIVEDNSEFKGQHDDLDRTISITSIT